MPSFREQFEELGEDAVREKLAAGVFGGRRLDAAKAWISEIDRRRALQTDEASVSESRIANELAKSSNVLSVEANALARRANSIAMAALVVAVIAAIAAVASIVR